MASSGGRRWRLGKEGIEMYQVDAFQEKDIADRLRTATTKHRDGLRRAAHSWGTSAAIIRGGLQRAACASSARGDHPVIVRSILGHVQMFTEDPSLTKVLTDPTLYADLADTILRAEQRCEKWLADKRESNQPTGPGHPATTLKPNENYAANRIRKLETELGLSVSEGGPVDLSGLRSMAATLSTSPQYDKSPRGDNPEEWKTWAQSVRRQTEGALAAKGFFDDNSSEGRGYRQQDAGVGRSRILKETDQIRAAKGAVLGKVDILEAEDNAGQEIVKIRKSEIEDHIRNHQQALGNNMHWMTKVTKAIAMDTEVSQGMERATVKTDGRIRTAQEGMKKALKEGIDHLKKDATGRYATGLASALETLQADTGMPVMAEALQWAKIADADTNWSTKATGLIPSKNLKIDAWLQERRSEAEILLMHVDKTPGIAATMRTKPAVLKADPVRLAQAYKDVRKHVNVVELRAMLKRCSAGRTGGPTGICREHLLYLPTDVLELFVPLVNSILDGQAPASLKLGTIMPLIKDSKRYRPVTLLESLWKATTTLVSDRFFQLVEEFGILEANQYAFRRNGSTAAPLDIAATAFQARQDPGVETHCIMLDFTSAYDTVPLWALDLAFRRLGAPQEFTDWIRNTTAGHTRIVSTNSGLTTDAFPLAGIPQGDPMSCFVWLVVCDMALSHAETTPGLGVQLAPAGAIPGWKKGEVRVKAQSSQTIAWLTGQATKKRAPRLKP